MNESQFANTYYGYVRYLLSPLCLFVFFVFQSVFQVICTCTAMLFLPSSMLCAVRSSVRPVPVRRANLLPPKSLSGSVTGAMRNMPSDICTPVSVLVLPYSDFNCSLTVLSVAIGKCNAHTHTDPVCKPTQPSTDILFVTLN